MNRPSMDSTTEAALTEERTPAEHPLDGRAKEIAPAAPTVQGNTPSKASAFRGDDGEFWFMDLGVLFAFVAALVSGATAALALSPIPETWMTDDAKEVLWGAILLVGTFAGFSLVFLGYVYKDDDVQAAARALAQEGLLNGRRGKLLRQALHALDRKAHQLSTLIQGLTNAHADLSATSAPEPLLLDELATRRDAAMQELEKVRAKAHALTYSDAATRARDDAALHAAMKALGKSRAIRST